MKTIDLQNFPRRAPLTAAAAAAAALVLSLAGCASSPDSDRAAQADTPARSTTSPESGEPGGSAGSLRRGDTRAISADAAVLDVRGMSCPKCANNITLKLHSVAGVDGVEIDMGAGEVLVRTPGPIRPSPAQLASAIEDAGFTLVGMRRAAAGSAN